MDIKQAIERVANLEGRIEEMGNVLTMLERRREGDDDVLIDVWNPSASAQDHQWKRQALLVRSDIISALKESIRSHQEEINRLQPVIDMANAALKGIGA